MKSLAVLSAILTSSCTPKMLTVIDKEMVDLSFKDEKGRKVEYNLGVLYFDADGNEETTEYLGMVEMLFLKDPAVFERARQFKKIKICDQDYLNIWENQVGCLIKTHE